MTNPFPVAMASAHLHRPSSEFSLREPIHESGPSILTLLSFPLRDYPKLHICPGIPEVGTHMDAPAVRTLMTGWLLRADPVLSRELLNAGRIRHFAHGAMIHAFEQEQVCLWGIVSGLVRIFVAMNEQEPKLAHCAGPGFWFGDAPVVTGQTRAMQSMTVGETTLCAIDRSAVVAIARTNPDAWLAVATLSVMNELLAIGAGEDLMIRDSRKRLVAVLLRLAGHRNAFQGAQPISTVPVTQIELAEASTLSLSSATRILNELAKRGMIRTDYRSVAILEPNALEALLVG